MKRKYIYCFFIIAILFASCQKPTEGLILRLSGQRVEAMALNNQSILEEPTAVPSGSEAESERETDSTEKTIPQNEKTSSNQQYIQSVIADPNNEQKQPSERETEELIPSGEIDSAANDLAETPASFNSTEPSLEGGDIVKRSEDIPDTGAVHAESPDGQSGTTFPDTETTISESSSEDDAQVSIEPSETHAETTATATSQDLVHTENNAVGIELVSLPDKTLYDKKSERVALEGLTVRAFWADGTERILGEDEYSLLNDSLQHGGDNEFFISSLGVHVLYVKYGSSLATFSITVAESEDAPLTVCRIKQGRSMFYVGEYTQTLFGELGTDFRSVSPLDPGVSFSPERLTEAGATTVRISYGQHTADIALTVLPHTAFVPDPGDLYSGDRVSGKLSQVLHTGQVLSAEILSYVINDWRVIITDIVPAEEFVFEPAVITEKGQQTITVSCRGVTWTFPVNVRK